MTSQSFYDVTLWFAMKKEATFLFCVMVLSIFDQIRIYIYISWPQSYFSHTSVYLKLAISHFYIKGVFVCLPMHVIYMCIYSVYVELLVSQIFGDSL